MLLAGEIRQKIQKGFEVSMSRFCFFSECFRSEAPSPFPGMSAWQDGDPRRKKRRERNVFCFHKRKQAGLIVTKIELSSYLKFNHDGHSKKIIFPWLTSLYPSLRMFNLKYICVTAVFAASRDMAMDSEMIWMAALP